MKSYCGTDVGQRRKENQDAVFASEQSIGNLPNLFVVADGMGGHNAGEFASRCAISVLTDAVKKNMSFNPIKIMRHGIESANEQIYLEASLDPSKTGMGTTVVAVTIVGHYAYIANVGDSRLYLLNSDGIVQITKDHSLTAEMVRMGRLTKEEAINHPNKNIITRAVGIGDFVTIDFFDVELDENTQILLCSDGLSNMVSDDEMYQIVRSSQNIEEAGEKLVDLANDNGGVDNISVIIVEPFTNEVKEC